MEVYTISWNQLFVHPGLREATLHALLVCKSGVKGRFLSVRHLNGLQPQWAGGDARWWG